MVGNLLVKERQPLLGSRIGSSLPKQPALNLLIMNATFFKATRVIDGTVVTDVDHILNGVTPVLDKYLRAMSSIRRNCQ
jgi:hypothetical protein